jgi:Family of unknown function (DUF6084)
MPELDFRVESVAAVPYAAAPTLAFRLRVTNANREEVIHSMALRAQIQIEVTRRHYSAEDDAVDARSRECPTLSGGDHC